METENVVWTIEIHRAERRSTEEEEEETKKTKKTKAKDAARRRGYANRYVRMMETMKRAMRYRREEASVSSKTSVVGCLWRREERGTDDIQGGNRRRAGCGDDGERRRGG